ncbi:hypothetical protein DEO48_25610 [Enterobacter sp. CGMCC 5087]|nr:hypothetical protein DEO48_25610 [Enterobacter sp. CGMCC 5087]
MNTGGLHLCGRYALLLVLAALSTGCADTRWMKAGAGPQAREQQMTACEAQALRDLPPDNVVSHRDVRGKGTLKDSGKANAEQSTDYRVQDANRWQRETLVRDCMFRAGWSEVSAGGGA